MGRGKSAHLTESELRLMNVLWARGASTVSEVLDALPSRPALAYSTVITTLRILEEKGYVRHRKEGRAFQYEPVIERQDARRSVLTQVLQRFFDGSPELLMASLFEAGEVDANELRRLRKLIDEAGREQ